MVGIHGDGRRFARFALRFTCLPTGSGFPGSCSLDILRDFGLLVSHIPGLAFVHEAQAESSELPVFADLDQSLRPTFVGS